MAGDSDVPDGWTDDCSVTVAPEHTLDELVTFVLTCDEQGTHRSEMMSTLTVRFGLSFDDARLAVDRVRGGWFRGEIESNEPDPIKDPLASISYRRAQGAPALLSPLQTTRVWRTLTRLIATNKSLEPALEYVGSPEFQGHSRVPEREAAGLLRAVVERSSTARPVSSATAAVRLLELAEAVASSDVDKAVPGNMLIEVGTALTSVGESRIGELPEQTCATAGTPAWFDAIKLSEAAGRLSTLFRQIGDDEHEAAALDIRGRITTHLLGHCPHRVGVVMLDSARCAIRHGDMERAASLCESVIQDFARIVQECEDDGTAVCDEEELAVRQLLDAIDIYDDIRGSTDQRTQRLRSRCSALLSATPDE